MLLEDSDSPYQSIPVNEWLDKTLELIERHPLQTQTLVDAVGESEGSVPASQH